jgi:hypothetical protein
MSETSYIDDGYTVDGYLAAAYRLFPAIRFTYRPVMVGPRAVIARKMAEENDAAKAQAIAAEVLKKHVQKWDLKRRNGELVPLETSHILRMQPSLFNLLFRVVMGELACDEDPEAAQGAGADVTDRALAAALEGCSPEEYDSKNSQPG